MSSARIRSAPSPIAKFVGSTNTYWDCQIRRRPIWPAALHQPLHGVIGAVRIRTELDLIDVGGTIVDIQTSQSARMDQMHRFELATCARLTPGASGVVRSDILVARNAPQHLERTWEATEADIRWTDS